MIKLHYIQYLHIWNSIVALILTCILIAVAANIKYYVSSGAAIAGFGNYNVFVYPATFVYMFIPAISAFIYAILLGLDSSPKYAVWTPSKTLCGSIVCVAGALFLASLWPLVPGADVLYAPDAAISCSWKYYMSWYVIYANPEAFPWVDAIDNACSCFTGAVGISWVLTFGWIIQAFIYVRKHIIDTRRHRRHQEQPSGDPHRRSAALSERSLKTLSAINQRPLPAHPPPLPN